MKTKIAFALLATATTLTGCASVFDGGAQSVNIRPASGEPVNVEVTSKAGTSKMQIPTTLRVDHNKQDLLIKVDDKCYEPTEAAANAQINPWAIGNVFFGLFGLTGTTVDASSGNAWKYDNTVIVPTTKKAGCK